MVHILTEAISRTFTIAVLVFVAMLLVDYVNVLTRGKFSGVMKRGRFRQYASASFLGATPGCLGAFITVSFYIHGVITFGAMFGGMVATCGDEAFVMLAAFPGYALMLFGILFVISLGFAWLSDAIGPLLGPRYGQGCKVEVLHGGEECCQFDRKEVWSHLKRMSPRRAVLLLVLIGAIVASATGVLAGGKGLAGEHNVTGHHEWEGAMAIVFAAIGLVVVATSSDHYLQAHIMGHIVKKHLWKVVLWAFFALLIVGVGLEYWDLEALVREHRLLVLLLAALLGLIPQSGPHLIFVTMFATGVVPFSVLLTSSISQEGHALLPLLSCSVRDALTIKGMKLILALAVGILVHALGW